MHIADPRAKLVARMRGRERQLAAQRDDVLQVQIGGLPAREPGGLARHFRSDAGIAVAIAANPGSESYRRDVSRKPGAGRCSERAVDGAQILRKRVPQTLLEHHEARPHFVERAHARATHFVGLPGGGNLALKVGERFLLLVGRQVGPVATRQDLRDAIVFLQQRAPDDLGGVRREDQLDAHRDDGGRQGVGGHAIVP